MTTDAEKRAAAAAAKILGRAIPRDVASVNGQRVELADEEAEAARLAAEQPKGDPWGDRLAKHLAESKEG